MWLSPESTSFKGTILKYLEEIGCCSRCILRLMGERDYKAYIYIENINEKLNSFFGTNRIWLESESISVSVSNEELQPPLKKAHITPCICCMGALQQGLSTKVVEQIVKSVEDSEYEIKDFVLRLTVPPNIELREHLLLKHLVEKFSDVYTLKVIASIAKVRDVWKWAVGPVIGRKFSATFNPFSNFSVSVFYSQEDFEEEIKPLVELSPSAFPNRNRIRKSIQECYSRSSVLKALEDIGCDELKKHYSFPPQVPQTGINFDVVVCHQDSIYFAGRYNKYSRNLSQTPWYVDGIKRKEDSVEELIVETIKKHIIVDKIVFSASGREDVDVRMLGNGRPFVLELFNSRLITFSKEKFMNMQMV